MKQQQPQATQLIASPPLAYTISWPICTPLNVNLHPLYSQSINPAEKRAPEINLNASNAYAT